MQRRKRAFTLVEILIVVVILGILAGIVVAQFANATEEAAVVATKDQLRKLRDALAVYQLRNSYELPNVEAGSGTWGELISVSGEYLRRPPLNRWVGPEHGRIIRIDTGPDQTFQTGYGWIFNPATGDVWAAAFDEFDEPYPKP